jgi:hypothetical protein
LVAAHRESILRDPRIGSIMTSGRSGIAPAVCSACGKIRTSLAHVLIEKSATFPEHA